MMTHHSNYITPLDYAVARGVAPKRRLQLRGWIVLGSLAPIPTFVSIAYTSGIWSRWLGIGQGWERATGILWLVSAGSSLAWIFILGFSQKRWDVWSSLVFHVLFVALTALPPGCIAVAWLMHWLSGPGA